MFLRLLLLLLLQSSKKIVFADYEEYVKCQERVNKTYQVNIHLEFFRTKIIIKFILRR